MPIKNLAVSIISMSTSLWKVFFCSVLYHVHRGLASVLTSQGPQLSYKCLAFPLALLSSCEECRACHAPGGLLEA